MNTQKELAIQDSRFTEIQSSCDFDWYTRKLDVAAKYGHCHHGKPTQFPCLVESEWGDDPNGPYYYSHRFVYKKTTKYKCDHCGHESTNVEWDYESA